MKNLGVSYLFWACGLIGLSGLHRIYNGKIGSGLLWMCTWGLLGIGQLLAKQTGIPTLTEAV